MTIEPDPPAAGHLPEAGEITQFVFRIPSSTELLQRAAGRGPRVLMPR